MSSNIRLNRICHYCGEEFIAKTTVTKYCSDKCAKYAYKKRKRQEKIDASNKETEVSKLRPLIEIQAKEFLSITELSQILGVSRWTINRALKKGTIKAVKIGRHKFIRKDDLNELFKP